MVRTTKVFRSGNSQAVRIPKEFAFESEEVEIRKRGNTIVIRPRARSWALLLDSLEKFSDDFMTVRSKQPPLDKRTKAFR